MRGERWYQVVAVFEKALELPPEERDQFVNEATGSDPELRERVAAMLRADSAAHPLLDATDEALAAASPATAAPGLGGRTIGPYTVMHEIGRGGMATVYLATDVKHRRSVAIKLLNADASSVVGGERFRREIDVVAQLHHPHILPLYDSGETDGLLYYVMPLVSGETLRERIAREGQLPIDDARRIAMDVGVALDYAHRRGVVHRDVKPANILLDEEHATVADFGIAYRVRDDSPEQLTATGIVIGTPAYMSPEQAYGERELDARSDVYALGCVLFETLTGEPPFRAARPAALAAQHLQAPVPSARALRPLLPERVDEVFRKALAKDPEARFPSAREFVQAFDSAFESVGDVEPQVVAPAASPPASASGRRWLIAATAAVVAIVAAASWLVLGRGDAPPSIAVLPFANMSDDRANEYFSDGVTEELTGALAQLALFRVTPRTTTFAYKGRTGDITRIGRELGVGRIVEGSVRRQGDRVRIVAAMYDVKSGERLWNETYDREFGSVLALQTEIATTIAERLHRRLVPGDRARLIGRHTVDPQAYDSYLKGRYFFDQRTAASLEQAVGHFRQALAIDSLYARAYAGLADSYSILAWTGFAPPLELFPLAERAARRALALDSMLAEAHVSLGIIHTFHTWDWTAADREITGAIELDSTSSLAWQVRAWHGPARGRTGDGLTALRRARELEPLSMIVNARIGTYLTWLDRYREAEAALRKALEIEPSYPVARVQLARLLSVQGRHVEAVAALPSADIRLGSFESGIAGYVLARAGRRGEALAAAQALESRAYVPAEGVAAIYAGLGDRATALTWLERAVETRGVGLIHLAVEPMYDSLRDDPRYRRVVSRIGLVE